MIRAALALIHHPVLDRDGGVVTTTITTLDLHDLARCARTYGLERLYAIQPLTSQRHLAQRVKQHWVRGSGRQRIPDRGEALRLLRVVPTLEEACADLAPDVGRRGVELWATSADGRGATVMPFAEARQQLPSLDRPLLLCFGTGWGLAGELLRETDRQLEPIRGADADAYNHLSVRAACAIALDRLFG